MDKLTNYEKARSIYSTIEKPTDPEEVISRTPLEELNLNWREKDLPEKIRTKHVHRLHPYLGKYIPQLVEIFLRKSNTSLTLELLYSLFFNMSNTQYVDTYAPDIEIIYLINWYISLILICRMFSSSSSKSTSSLHSSSSELHL